MKQTRTDFINEVMGLDFKNIQGKYSFASEKLKRVLFSLNPDHGGYLILSRRFSPNGVAHSLKHIDLILNHGYDLYVYPVSIRKLPSGMRCDYEPRLEKRRLVIKDGEYYAYPMGDSLEQVVESFEDQVSRSELDSASVRAKRLLEANPIPSKRTVTVEIFERNPDVVAEVRDRSKGECEGCHQSAPFNRRSDGKPYLEVHHVIPLAQGGRDTVENAIALCPNCHRKAHYG